MKRHALFLATLLWCGVALHAQTTTAPALTADQQAELQKYNKAPTDQPLQKRNMRSTNPDGSANADFGKPDDRFLKMHAEFIERSKQPAQVLFLGDSITAGWMTRAKDLFDQKYGKPYQAANFGIGGDRTENVLWRIEQGELDGFKDHPPKVVVLMIGTNDQSNHTPEEVATGTTAVVKAVRAKLPTTKILLLSIFPRAAAATDAARVKIAAANEILSKLDDGNSVKYLKLWDQFLEADGTLSKEIMPDLLHPSAKGYEIWVREMEPMLSEMMK